MGTMISTEGWQGRLQGRRTVITGAARGIGAEIARTFANEGARVVLLDVAADEVRNVAKELEGDSIEVDLTDASATAAATT